MSLSGIFSSHYQRRSFLVASTLVIAACGIIIMLIAFYGKDDPLWEAFNNFIISIVASGAFAIISTLYLSYFTDPRLARAETLILPQDINENLHRLAGGAHDYRIYVRTGRHFRAKALPALVKHACESRQPIRMEVILLDFRDVEVCERYAEFRKSASFDHYLWDTKYVQHEVLATIIAIAKAVNLNRPFIQVDLRLSNRLSTFRIEGNADEMIVTREDPKDYAYCYTRKHRDFSGLLTEFNWVKREAEEIPVPTLPDPATCVILTTMFGELISPESQAAAAEALNSPAPYAR
ncbi:hypothetical protein [Pseudomonas sp. FFUP_PS_473]|uniref:hypothetical protein n=1 Tax=Pseudomonas sp. FFUP_PS_473 TaxID=2060418 RepID=UPI0011AE8ABA|nr:hypothetical protein [Pseudomonas sp. FFUP_PS_473]